jgi:hypothetical protein
MSKSNLIKYTDKALMDLSIRGLQLCNPKIQIGEQMRGPAETVRGSKIIKSEDDSAFSNPPNFIPAEALPIDFEIPFEEQVTTLTANLRLKISLSVLESIERGEPNMQALKEVLDMGYNSFSTVTIFPYRLEMPHREVLENYSIGDQVVSTIFDLETLKPRRITTVLTAEMIEKCSFVTLQFGAHVV